jgi:hypothetical protein
MAAWKAAGKARKLRVPTVHPRGGGDIHRPGPADHVVAEWADWRPVTTRPALPAHDPGT